MQTEKIIIKPLKNCGDKRGDSFCVPEDILQPLKKLKNFHFATILQGKVRGNHFHAKKKELIVIMHSDDFAIGWQRKNKKYARKFKGQGAIAILIPPGISHAVKNTGRKPLLIIACSDHALNTRKPDVFKRIVL